MSTTFASIDSQVPCTSNVSPTASVTGSGPRSVPCAARRARPVSPLAVSMPGKMTCPASSERGATTSSTSP